MAAMNDARRNVELKARDPDPVRTAAACAAIGAEECAILRQRDTYFTVHHGWLKLREENPGSPRLIQYMRADAALERLSNYRIIEVDDAEESRHALAQAVGVLGEVAKRRRLFLWQNVRIHLDNVEGLGTFVELEAVAPPSSDLVTEHRIVAELRRSLRITDDRLCPTGYAHQLGLKPSSHRSPEAQNGV